MTALALTPQAATASVLLQLTGVPGDMVNLVPNPSIEVDTSNWQELGTGTTIARSTAQKDVGIASLLATIGTDNGQALRTGIITPATSPAGKTLGWRIRVRSTTATSLRALIRCIAADGATTITYLTGPTVAVAANTWTTLSVTGVAPAGTTFLRGHMDKLDATARNVYVDAAVMRVLASWETFNPEDYFEGSRTASLSIVRSDANGVSSVRLRTGQAPIGGVLTVTDYEPALLGNVTYDVVDVEQVRTTATTSLAGLVTTPRIVGVQEPQLVAAPELVTGYDAQRESGSAVLRVIGRGDPVVLLAPTRTREGRLEVWARDYADALEAADVMAESKILLLRQTTHPGMDMYFLAQSVSTQPLQRVEDGWRWQTTAQYIEVRNPNLPLLGASGWTFDDVVAGYPSFAALRSAFDSFNELVVGP